MTAYDLLTRAAAKARETAKGADRGPWYVNREAPDVLPDVIAECRGESCEGCGIVASMLADVVAEHIARWDPPTALLVADWLDETAAEWLASENSLGAASVRAMSGATNDADPIALALARSILEED